MIPVINAARQENSRRSVRIADMLRLSLHAPAKQSWHLEGSFVYPVADSGTREKMRVALRAITAGYPTVGDGTSAAK
jgi:hypothetical protein